MKSDEINLQTRESQMAPAGLHFLATFMLQSVGVGLAQRELLRSGKRGLHSLLEKNLWRKQNETRAFFHSLVPVSASISYFTKHTSSFSFSFSFSILLSRIEREAGIIRGEGYRLFSLHKYVYNQGDQNNRGCKLSYRN